MFVKELYHTALAQILSPLRPGMTTPHVMQCPDGHFRRAVFELGPFIADYPEQVCLAGIVSGWCPKYVLFLHLIELPNIHSADASRIPMNLRQLVNHVFASTRRHLSTRLLRRSFGMSSVSLPGSRSVFSNSYCAYADILMCSGSRSHTTSLVRTSMSS